jgi:hypothetical protein
MKKLYKYTVAIGGSNYSGISRSIMISINPKRYFDKAWRNRWISILDDKEEIKKRYSLLGLSDADLNIIVNHVWTQ